MLYLCGMATIAQGASASRSDTIDIRKTIIHFMITDVGSHQISAQTELHLRSLQNNVNALVFDLEGLTVDSVFFNGTNQSFTYVSPFIRVDIAASPMNLNDTATVQIYYHGTPVTDPNWGGFTFAGLYAFQIGVGFQAQPHSFGRTWHPCFDNFVERSPYEFFITTADSLAGICNGLLLDSTANPVTHTRTWHWKLDQEIPSYLACLAVSRYTFLHKTLNGLAGTTDAIITCEAADSNMANASFGHLQESFTMLENHFGLYQWPRVGYSLVPFAAGAMEHATNISIGKAFIDGTFAYETMIAHELAHHWWGDLVTCSTAGDMWLSEGFASYCEPLHLGYVYGPDAYIAEVKANHYFVLSRAHIDDEGYRAITPMDSLFTYGTTVYNKAEDALHTLRTYMGDQAFFDHLRSFLSSHAFQAVNTIQLRDYLAVQSGIDLTPYFNNWILSPGFTHFSIDSIHTVPEGSDTNVLVYLRQRKHHSNDYYEKVPLELAFYESDMTRHIYHLQFSGRCMQFTVKLPFNPVMVVIDPDAKISDAITDEERIIKSTGNITLAQAKCRILVKSLVSTTDSSLVHFEHHWVAPDRFKSASSFPGYALCNSRYWRIDGIHLANLKGQLQFNYDAGSANSYLDSTWIRNTDDSIRLFYRKDATEEWQLANDSLKPGGLSDKLGTIYAKEIKAGEYTFGIKKTGYIDTLQTDAPGGGCGVVTLLETPSTGDAAICRIFPNPASTSVSISLNEPCGAWKVELFDALGRRSRQQEFPAGVLKASIDLSSCKPGVYYIKISSATRRPSVHKLIRE